MNKFKAFMNSVNWAAPVLLIPVVMVMHLAGLITLSWLPGPSPRQAQSVADHAGILFGLCLGNIMLTGPALLLPRLGELQKRIVGVATVSVTLIAIFSLVDTAIWSPFSIFQVIAVASSKSWSKSPPSGQQAG